MQVAQVFGYDLALVVDGDDGAEQQQQQPLEPLSLHGLKAKLTTATAGSSGQQPATAAAGRSSRVGYLCNVAQIQHTSVAIVQ